MTIFERVLEKKNLYRFFVGEQFLPDLIKVLSILPQSLDKLFLNEYEEKKAMIQKGCLKTIKEDNNIHFVFKRKVDCT